ncbi:PHDfinger domain containing protein [Acanthamoeba castellanii str. Neff]|uniref:PHDfinger domain containing protein n=1 Tax=Acanthamoeba castellanii (strain ATCC 30010 / Neff) TaxID=1257118 RepID=L8GDS2_ACACF|nr:PHDfinger domain containing protein [Acanthamoeba castellanii str. Neff]ELR10868.1 PHDfinger domain containing protein [Acanthamoeba castellanii str. Neff]
MLDEGADVRVLAEAFMVNARHWRSLKAGQCTLPADIVEFKRQGEDDWYGPGLVACFQRMDLINALDRMELREGQAYRPMDRTFPVSYCTQLSGSSVEMAIVLGPATLRNGSTSRSKVVPLYSARLASKRDMKRLFLLRHHIVANVIREEAMLEDFVTQFAGELPDPRDDLWKKHYCVCKRIDDGAQYVECHQCARWCHPSCIEMAQLPAQDEAWYCSECSKSAREERKRKGEQGGPDDNDDDDDDDDKREEEKKRKREHKQQQQGQQQQNEKQRPDTRRRKHKRADRGQQHDEEIGPVPRTHGAGVPIRQLARTKRSQVWLLRSAEGDLLVLKLVRDVVKGKQEAGILKRLQGVTRHIPRFLTSGLFECGKEWYHGLVLGCIEHEEAYRQPDSTFASYVFQLLSALRELHELGVVHHDISHNNVLYSIPTGELTIIDFEVATNRRLGSTWSEFAPVGTPGYLAPELLDSCGWCPQVSHKIDIWAAGVLIAWQLLNVPMPDDQVNQEVSRMSFEEVAQWAQASAGPACTVGPQLTRARWGLVTQLLCIDPERRLDAASACQLFPSAWGTTQQL